MRRLFVPLILIGLLAAPDGSAQATNGGFDSTYVMDLTHQVTGRLYFNNKFNALDLDDRKLGSHIEYRPNTNVNFGVGISYRSLTLNIGLGVPALNRDDSLRGRTSYLDAQANVFGRRFAINLFAQLYRGYYINELSYPAFPRDPRYEQIREEQLLRPDMRQRNLGATVLHIVNNQRFSYRAAFNQDAWQRRSAGSWLVGGNFVYQGARADRSGIPEALDSLWREPLRFRRIDQIEVGPMGGYAHTFVLKERFYLSFSAGLGIGLVRSKAFVQDEDEYVRQIYWSPNFRTQGRLAFGYNTMKSGLGISYTNEQSQTVLESDAIYAWSVGTFRLFYVLRFDKRIKPVDDALRRIGRG
ncbi:MAG: DUF4421 domain-containing protein [Flavobacteriales bacterium]|nr:DUF4421 domain-containing protein [Flavobacteriales bacterium]